MRGVLTAVGFLTVLPVGPRGEPRRGDLGRAVVWFPLVGLLIGLLAAGVDWCGRALWDSHIAAALVIGATLLLTGGLHLDGLMDTADAFFSHRDREGMLQVMRDSRAGALGVAAGLSVIVAKFAAYGHLEGVEHWRVIAVTPLIGRLGLVVGMALFPYARETGMGARFAAETKLWHSIGAATIAVATALALMRWGGLALAGMAILLALLSGAYASRRLGGLTGDVYGAINELVELLALLAAALILGRQT